MADVRKMLRVARDCDDITVREYLHELSLIRGEYDGGEAPGPERPARLSNDQASLDSGCEEDGDLDLVDENGEIFVAKKRHCPTAAAHSSPGANSSLSSGSSVLSHSYQTSSLRL